MISFDQSKPHQARYVDLWWLSVVWSWYWNSYAKKFGEITKGGYSSLLKQKASANGFLRHWTDTTEMLLLVGWQCFTIFSRIEMLGFMENGWRRLVCSSAYRWIAIRSSLKHVQQQRLSVMQVSIEAMPAWSGTCHRIRINADAGKKAAKVMSSGAVLRDHEGKMMAAVGNNVEIDLSPVVGDAMAGLA